MLQNISKAQIIDRMRIENPWWVTNTIDSDYDDMPRRPYFDLFKPLAFEKDPRRALVLMGPRRVGKTVMLHHMVKELIIKGVNPKKIIFLTIENPIYINQTLEQLFLLAKEASGSQEKDDWFVIFDEIQYCKQWEVHLKTLVDTFRSNKFIVSGSAAAALKYKSNESGAGRFTDFLLPPLSFYEYIQLLRLSNLIISTRLGSSELDGDNEFFTSTHMDEFNRHFMNYINYGGYPEVIFSTAMQANPGRFIRHDIVDKVLLRDLPSLYGIQDVQELNALFTSIVYNTANEFSYEELSRQSGVQKATLKKYIEYLEAAFLIKQIKRIDQNAKRFERDNFFKLYLTNPSMRSALFSPLEPTDIEMGNTVETTIYSQWLHDTTYTPFYARWSNGEVDLVGLDLQNFKPVWAVEVKWSNRFFDNPKDLKSMSKFCEENDLNDVLVTTIDKEGDKKYKNINISFLPAASYAYTIGLNILEGKKRKSARTKK